MKIYISSLLLAIVLFTAFGIAKYVHYCGDEISAESFFIKDSGTCGCDDEEDGCCHDKAMYVQALQEYTHTPTSLPDNQTVLTFNTIDLQKCCNNITNFTITLQSSLYLEKHSPPIHILYRSLLI